MEDDPGEYDFTEFLPEFREKGIVTIIDAVHGNRVLHPSTLSRDTRSVRVLADSVGFHGFRGLHWF
jgi:hypothetical protein